MSILAEERAYCNAHKQLDQLIGMLEDATEVSERIDRVERMLFDALLGLGRHLLEGFVARAGDGDVGETLTREGGELARLPAKHSRVYRSVFGNLELDRFVYGTREGQRLEWIPLDAKLGLPAGEQSYLLEDWLQRLCVKESFKEAVGGLREILGTRTSVRAAERMNRDLGRETEAFLESQPAIDREAERQILVVTADGKGIPMRCPLEQRVREAAEAQQPVGPPPAAQAVGEPPPEPAKPRKKRLGRGEKRTRKQMAYVGAVYSIAPFVRSPSDILDDLCRRQRQSERPRPQNKRLYAEMTHFREGQPWDGQPQLFAELAVETLGRDPDNYQAIVCLMDGQRSLWKWQESFLGRAVPILDIFHVNERLWKAAYCFHSEGSPQAEQFVERYLRMLLEGNATSVYAQFHRLARRHKLSGSKRKALEEVVGYLRNNRRYMRYDEYLAAGYPIGSGVVEGACRHLVKDRMELTGMRWQIEGARPMIQLRAIHLNNQWDDYIEFRIRAEQRSLYGQAA